MIINGKKHALVYGRMVDERRTGINRRVLTYDWYIPERRTIEDRRQQNRNSAGSNHGEWRDRRRYA